MLKPPHTGVPVPGANITTMNHFAITTSVALVGLDLEIPEILENINLQDGEIIVDVGGGSGHLLLHMLDKWPES
ncbi:hypothetical protein D3C76_1026970 [compost metagenome]